MIPTKCIVILGPTSSGKSDLAVKLAKKVNGEIISVDSRQIYKDMNLGTGKIEGKWEKIKNVRSLASEKSENLEKVFIYKNIPHHLIDFQNPTTHSSENKKYTVVNFKKDCPKIIRQIANKNKVPILCGGTGFWISVIVDNITLPAVKPNPKLRSKLGKKTPKQLFTQLQKQDPQRAKNIDSKNKFRLIRALEICKELGTVPEPKNNPPKNLNFLQIGLDYPVEKLAIKIKKRLASRWTDGMIKEVKNLKKKHKMSWKNIQAFGLAYYWIPLYLQSKLQNSQGNFITEKKLARNELLQRVYFAEKNYAKRQRTWFQHNKQIIWTTDFKKILKLSKKFLSS